METFCQPQTPYWARKEKNSNAEVDYVFVRDGEVYALEVKSGPSGKLRSLHLLLNEHESVKTAYVFNSGNVDAVGKLRFRPFYTRFDEV